MDDDLAWENAGFAIFGRSDMRPLVELLRTDRPIPLGIRDVLATMLDPDSEGYLHYKLELVSLETKRKGMERDLEALSVTGDYRERRHAGSSSEVAAEETAAKFKIDPRTVYRREQHWEKIRRFLSGTRRPDTK